MKKSKVLTSAIALSGMFCLAFPTNAWAGANASVQSVQQAQKITGQVIDETGEPMIGVTVKLKGTSYATVTDLDGNFVLDVPSKSGQLEFSYIGYKVKTVPVGNGTVKVTMDPDSQVMDEVVVVGYGTMKKRDVTGSITSIKAEDITLNPGSNPMEALQGKVAGLDITKSSGRAGEGVTMQLRGTRSFTADGNPTFIIDGMPGDYSTLNPNDIESIEVLKDASSTAVYGAAGANGVVIITTKSGKAGKATVNFNAFLGVNGWSNTPKVRSGESYISAIRTANEAVGNQWDDETLINNVLGTGAYDLHKAGKYIDWTDELLKTGITQNYSVSISGGTDKTKAYMSLNFSDETGQYANDNNKIYSSNIRVDHKVKDWLSVGVNAQLSYTYRNNAKIKLESGLKASPLGELYDEDGNLNPKPLQHGNLTNLLLNNHDNFRQNREYGRVYLNPYIELRPFKGFSILSRLNLTYVNSISNNFTGIGSYDYYNNTASSSDTFAEVSRSTATNYKWENIFTYNFQVAKAHDFTVTFVTSYDHNRTESTYQKETNISDNAYLWHKMGLNPAYFTGNSGYTMSKGMGYIGRINYSYLGKYLASASVRHDGSSRLADGNRWDTFPAFSLGWRMSEEKFMEGTRSWLSNLKLRFGWGVTGTAKIDPFTSVSNLEQASMSLVGSNQDVYYFSQNYANRNLGWEKSYNTNFGIDASFLKNRIDVNLDYYYTKTKGVIWSRPLPIVNGGVNASSYYQMYMNICETQNNGFEAAINTRNIIKKDFTWSSTITFNYNKEKIKKLIDGTANYITNGSYALALGEPVNSFYNYKLVGVWKEGQAADAAVFNQAPGDLIIDVPGMRKVEDGVYTKGELDADGNVIYYTADNKYTYSDQDYQILGHNSPDWTLGFQNQFTWKNFDLSVFMFMRWGQTIQYDLLGAYDPTGVGNFPAYFLDKVGSYFPALNANRDITSYTGYYGLTYVDGSFFKVKNITLGYTLPKNIMTKVGIEKCRFYATVTNPIVIAKSNLLKDYDPEMNGSIDYPLTKQLVFGVNVTF